jgi:hypothetical protein
MGDNIKSLTDANSLLKEYDLKRQNVQYETEGQHNKPKQETSIFRRERRSIDMYKRMALKSSLNDRSMFEKIPPPTSHTAVNSPIHL